MSAIHEGERQAELRSAAFRRGREGTWRRLEALVMRMEKTGAPALSAEEARLLPLLYRATLSSLSVARTIVLDRNLLLYLENLSLRAYLVVYGPRSGVLENLSDFFRRDFPRHVRSMRRHLLLAALALLVGALAGFLLVRLDSDYFDVIVPSGLAGSRGPESTAEELIENELFAPWRGFAHAFIFFANALFRHNTLVGIFCFGLSFAFGVPTVLLLVYNGLILGAFFELHASLGLALPFVGWLSIHGVTEILAILLCGAAGFLVAEKILFPGVLSRTDSLALYGRRAASVVAGAVALFFVAGILEGGFRQLVSNTAGRYTIAAATLVLWVFYFTRVGRQEAGDG